MIHKKDFPFKEKRKESGDFFDTIEEVKALGYSEDQIWSVVCSDEDDTSTFVYGPSEHWVNRLGYIATKEKHDGNRHVGRDRKNVPSQRRFEVYPKVALVWIGNQPVG